MIGTLLPGCYSMQQRVGLQSDCPFVVSLDCGFVECHHDFVAGSFNEIGPDKSALVRAVWETPMMRPPCVPYFWYGNAS